ncbi:acetyltransferase [Janthinobacterium agaricidamnosum]|nr:acetyltransferase [Janthinobacterium agaricidamnosum]
MQITTENDYTGVAANHPLAGQFTIMMYAGGEHSAIPHNFFRDWLDQEARHGTFHIGRCSGFGVGSLAKYDAGKQNLQVGSFVSGGLRLRFLLNGQHETHTISTCMFSVHGIGLENVAPPQYGDSIIKNDVWIGDEVMMLGGGIIENGCIIGARSLLPPNFRSEPYGIYAGSPARLIRYRFSEKVRAALLELAWWEMPVGWIRENNIFFLEDMSNDEDRALMIIDILRASRQKWQAEHPPAA